MEVKYISFAQKVGGLTMRFADTFLFMASGSDVLRRI